MAPNASGSIFMAARFYSGSNYTSTTSTITFQYTSSSAGGNTLNIGSSNAWITIDG
jgi:hypothetical protein